MFDSSASIVSQPAAALPSSGMSGIEENFTKVAFALNQHSKAIVDLRRQLEGAKQERMEAFDQLSRAINGVHQLMAREDGAAAEDFGSAASGSLREQLMKLDASCASNFDLLSKAVTGAHEKLAQLERELEEVRPHLEAVKVHAESFPSALRAARRSDAEVQEAMKALDARLQKLEARPRKPKKQS